MSLSPEWPKVYDAGTAPKSMQDLELHIFVNDIASVTKNGTALELGCGTCTNYPTFRDAGMHYWGMEGSEAALRTGIAKFPELEKRVFAVDFTAIDLPTGPHLICDRAAIAHNDTKSIEHCINQIYKVLPTNGIFLGIDWFSSNHSEAQRGERVDERTRTGYADGQFANIGNVNFSSKDDILALFKDFKIGMLRERIRRTPAPYSSTKYMNFAYISKHFKERDYQTAVWDIFAIKDP